MLVILQSWPGLPRGVEFNPSDSDLLWHLAAEMGNGLAHRHPFISEFIKSGDEGARFGCTHPRDMPGMFTLYGMYLPKMHLETWCQAMSISSPFNPLRFMLYSYNDSRINSERNGTMVY